MNLLGRSVLRSTDAAPVPHAGPKLSETHVNFYPHVIPSSVPFCPNTTPLSCPALSGRSSCFCVFVSADRLSLQDHKVLKRAELGRIAAPFPAREVKNENAENIKHAFKSNTVRQAARPDTANQTHPGRCRVQAGRGSRPSPSPGGCRIKNRSLHLNSQRNTDASV